ncbi:chloride channel protein [Pedobacter sp. SD-b]|uniref:Chloride channel protein n=1 Tax=Pedobacter segetis TaxID=2793069 RepID=A0ABS1BNG8_9SPHI|nr:chloride channel protein [Pedobacter segetis]MBK0384312.1 chloride channel protein [Pedobacter segetis]
MPIKNPITSTKIKKLRVKFRRIAEKQKNKQITVILLSVLVGLIVGLAAILIKQITYGIENYATKFFPGFLLILTPLVGLVLVNLLNINIFKKVADFKGMRNVIDSIENHQSFIKLRLIYTKFITAGITIGFGGSSGMESAIITSGASIGSNMGKSFGLNYQLRTLLIGCGTAGGISAMYNAPIGGFLFALEVILPEFTPALLIPLLLSSATGKILFELIMGQNLRFDEHIDTFSYQSLPYVILVGFAGALTALYMKNTYSFCYKYLSRLHNPYIIALVGGSVLGLLIYFFPALYGEGYVSINELLHNNEPAIWENSILANPGFQPFHGTLILVALFFLRPVTTGLSLGSGGEGGYFAPSLVAGGLTGYLVFKLIFSFYGNLIGLEPNILIFLGMAATFACVMRAPVTAIFLIADTTQSYGLIVPLMITTTIAYTFKNYIDAYNPLQKGGHGTLQMEKFILNQINLRDIIEPIFGKIKANDNLREVIAHFSGHEHGVTPVYDDKNKIIGIIELKKVRELMKDFESYDTIKAAELMDTNFDVTNYTALRKKLLDNPSVAKEHHILIRKNEAILGHVSSYKMLSIYNQYLNNPDRLFAK